MKTVFIALAVSGLLITDVTAFPRFSVKDLNALVNQTLLMQSLEGKDCPYGKTGFGKATFSKQEKRQVAFDPAAQLVDVSGNHAWVAPNFAAGDQRGPCPGLNALANHGYLPHNGIADIPTQISACSEAFGMGQDLGTFLAIYGTVFDGNPLSADPGYSIGGVSPLESFLGGLLGGLLTTPSGLSGSHNNYEADSSPTRGDLYVTGDNYRLQIPRFQKYYDALPENTPAPAQYEALFPFRQAAFDESIATNPYFFYPLFAGVLVTPAGYAFPKAMMANHSAQYPQGYLDKETFKSFFAVSGTSGSFTYQEGWERIPDDWYKRPISDPYTIPAFFSDILDHGKRDPRLLTAGGNTGTVNSYIGIDPSALSKGVFNGATLTEGNRLECFIFQAIQAESPGLVASLFADVTKALQSLLANIASNLQGLTCPQLNGIDTSQYNKFPGFKRAKGAKQ